MTPGGVECQRACPPSQADRSPRTPASLAVSAATSIFSEASKAQRTVAASTSGPRRGEWAGQRNAATNGATRRGLALRRRPGAPEASGTLRTSGPRRSASEVRPNYQRPQLHCTRARAVLPPGHPSPRASSRPTAAPPRSRHRHTSRCRERHPEGEQRASAAATGTTRGSPACHCASGPSSGSRRPRT